MIIHIGDNISLLKEDIVMILDKESVEKSKMTEEFIGKLEKGNIIEKDIKTYIVFNDKKDGKYILYTSNISSVSLNKRLNSDFMDWRKVNG